MNRKLRDLAQKFWNKHHTELYGDPYLVTILEEAYKLGQQSNRWTYEDEYGCFNIYLDKKYHDAIGYGTTKTKERAEKIAEYYCKVMNDEL